MATRYFPALDGIRAVAVLLVFGAHGLVPDFVGGRLGVNIFFVLSGFLITRLLQEQIKQTGTISLLPFYVRRLARLYPALIAVTGFVLIFGMVLVRQPLHFITHEAIPALTYTTNFILKPNGFPNFMAHTWSLAVEEQFYLLWPLLLLLKVRTYQTQILLGVAFVAIFTVRQFGVYLRGDGLVIGCLLATLTERSLHRIALAWPAALVAGVFAITRSPIYAGGIADIAAAILIAAAVTQSGPASLLSVAPLRFTGKISYGLYLWHYPLVLMLSPIFHKASWLVILPLTFAVAIASYFLIEQPILKRSTGWTSKAKIPSPTSEWVLPPRSPS